MKAFQIFLLLAASATFFSCGSECDSNFNFTAETQLESDNWRSADEKYNANPTVENCTALNSESDKYIDALNGTRDCVATIDLEDFLSRLSFLEAQRIPDCN